nr:MAG TPA: hypothetical protein [Caudoviricetes sp.]
MKILYSLSQHIVVLENYALLINLRTDDYSMEV